MATSTRRQGPKRSEESQAAILAATRDELAESGWRKFSVDNVAKRARASKQTIYRWWPSIGVMCVDAGLQLLPPQGRHGRDPVERIVDLFGPLETAARAGHGHAVLRASLIAAADDSEASTHWRNWKNETLRAPMRNLMAELSAKRVVRRDWDIDEVMDLMLGQFGYKLVVSRAPIREGHFAERAQALLDGLQER